NLNHKKIELRVRRQPTHRHVHLLHRPQRSNPHMCPLKTKRGGKKPKQQRPPRRRPRKGTAELPNGNPSLSPKLAARRRISFSNSCAEKREPPSPRSRLGIPGQVIHSFRRKSSTHSDRSHPLIPIESIQRLRREAIHLFGLVGKGG